MIGSFKHKGLKKFWNHGSTADVQPNHKKKLQLILEAIDAAKVIGDINFPGSGLHYLKEGRYSGNWSVSVNGNWRVIFRFEAGEAHALDYLDYH